MGKGILDVHISRGMVFSIPFYSDTTHKESIHRIVFERFEDMEMRLQDAKQIMEWFAPENAYIDYSILQMRVVQEKGEWYQVIVNNATGTTLWTKNLPTQNFSLGLSS